jgi:hypothetical protein
MHHTEYGIWNWEWELIKTLMMMNEISVVPLSLSSIVNMEAVVD